MTVHVSINGVLRDFWSKLKQEYRKFYIETDSATEEDFEYKINDAATNEILQKFSFQSEEEMKYFLYVEFPMEIFGHAAPVYKNVMLDLLTYRSQQPTPAKLVLVSQELGRAIPSTLFFLSKTTAQVNHIRFFQDDSEIEQIWNECDVWITDDPKIIERKPEGKTVIKVLTDFNEQYQTDLTINNLSDLIQSNEQIEKPRIEQLD
jgi:hypothetical protein